MARPADADARVGAPDADTYPVFTEAPQKTYQLAADRARARRRRWGAARNARCRRCRTSSTPKLGVFMLTVLVCLALSLVSDAPLKELANPAVPENPAKAPWYFLGLQELVVVLGVHGRHGHSDASSSSGLVLIPYLDRETEGTGRVVRRAGRARRWCCAPRCSAWPRCSAVEAFAIHFGWIREWLPHVPADPHHRDQSGHGADGDLRRATRSGACGATTRRAPARSALFTCFLCGFVVLDHRRRPFPRAELGLLLVARRLAGALR